MGYVYLLLEVDKHGDETFKIGITKNDPTDRNSDLQTGNPDKIRVLNKYESVNYVKIEKWLHRKYASKKTLAENEWFSLNNDDVMSFIGECERADEMVNFMKTNNPFYK